MSSAWVRFRQSPEALCRVVAGEVIATTPGENEFSVLSGSARDAWLLLEAPRSMPDLVSSLGSIYSSRPDEIAPDVEALLDDLLQRGLVEEIVESDV